MKQVNHYLLDLITDKMTLGSVQLAIRRFQVELVFWRL